MPKLGGITIGADPEIFVGKNGSFVSAHGLVPGDKLNPFTVKHGAVQVDGLALEFNIDPATSYHRFQKNIDAVMDTLKAMVPDYDFLQDAAVVIPQDYFDSLPLNTLEIGCEPDVNAYTEDVNSRPNQDARVRAVGGHIHIGGIFDVSHNDSERWKLSMRLARLLDKYVGVYSLLWDGDDLRRSIYGQAGACRPKDYGVEYRSMSNSWLFNKRITNFVFKSVQDAVKALKLGKDVEGRLYQGIINSSDRAHPFFNNNPKANYVRGLLNV